MSDFKLPELKVVYSRNGEEIEQVVGEEGKQWWLDYEAKWDHTEIVGFVEIEYSEEKLKRFEEVKGINVNEFTLLQYVELGELGEGLEALKYKKENEELKQLLADLTEIVLIRGL